MDVRVHVWVGGGGGGGWTWSGDSRATALVETSATKLFSSRSSESRWAARGWVAMTSGVFIAASRPVGSVALCASRPPAPSVPPPNLRLPRSGTSSCLCPPPPPPPGAHARGSQTARRLSLWQVCVPDHNNMLLAPAAFGMT